MGWMRLSLILLALGALGAPKLAGAAAARMLLQSPGAFGDRDGLAFNNFYGDPWGTAGGYYDPYGPGYIPGFINVDVSKEYGAHFDFGPVAVDLTREFTGFSFGSAVGAGWAKDGRGYNVQVANGNVMDLSVTRDAGFGLWLLNGLVNINIGPDGRWHMSPTTATPGSVHPPGKKYFGKPNKVRRTRAASVGDETDAEAAEAASAGAPAAAAAALAAADDAEAGSASAMPGSWVGPGASGDVTVQGVTESPLVGAAAATAAQAAAALAAQQQLRQHAGALMQQQQHQQLEAVAAAVGYGTGSNSGGGGGGAGGAALPPQGLAVGGRRPCEGGVIARVIDKGPGNTKYICKYKKGAGPTHG